MDGFRRCAGYDLFDDHGSPAVVLMLGLIAAFLMWGAACAVVVALCRDAARGDGHAVEVPVAGRAPAGRTAVTLRVVA